MGTATSGPLLKKEVTIDQDTNNNGTNEEKPMKKQKIKKCYVDGCASIPTEWAIRWCSERVDKTEPNNVLNHWGAHGVKIAVCGNTSYETPEKKMNEIKEKEDDNWNEQHYQPLEMLRKEEDQSMYVSILQLPVKINQGVGKPFQKIPLLQYLSGVDLFSFSYVEDIQRKQSRESRMFAPQSRFSMFNQKRHAIDPMTNEELAKRARSNQWISDHNLASNYNQAGISVASNGPMSFLHRRAKFGLLNRHWDTYANTSVRICVVPPKTEQFFFVVKNSSEKDMLTICVTNQGTIAKVILKGTTERIMATQESLLELQEATSICGKDVTNQIEGQQQQQQQGEKENNTKPSSCFTYERLAGKLQKTTPNALFVHVPLSTDFMQTYSPYNNQRIEKDSIASLKAQSIQALRQMLIERPYGPFDTTSGPLWERDESCNLRCNVIFFVPAIINDEEYCKIDQNVFDAVRNQIKQLLCGEGSSGSLKSENEI